MMIKTPFIQTQKRKHLLMKVTLMIYLNQPILQFYQTYKKICEKAEAELLIQS